MALGFVTSFGSGAAGSGFSASLGAVVSFGGETVAA